jgi:hypothetical protein
MADLRARRTIGSYVSSHALAPGTRAALEALGYAVVPVMTVGRFTDADWPVDLRLADARQLDRLPDDEVPTILLGTGRGPETEGPRLVGCVTRPAAVATLYPLLQRALESRPRQAARAPASLPARCIRADRRWSGEVLQLSQSGCLIRSLSDLALGLEINLSFPLPLGRMVSTRARVSTWTPEGAGLEFRGISALSRDAIGDFVQRKLATTCI